MSGISEKHLIEIAAFSDNHRYAGASSYRLANLVDDLIAEILRLRAENEGLRPLAKVGLEAIEDCSWHGCNFDVGDIQESAVKAGAIQESAEGYDPALHGESDICDPGDGWYEFPPAVLAAKRTLEEGE